MQTKPTSSRVKSVQFSPDGSRILVGFYSGTVELRDMKLGTLQSFDVTLCPIRCAKFHPRKNTILCGSDDLSVYEINIDTQSKDERISHAHGDYIRDIAIHADSPYLYTCSDDHTVRRWHLETYTMDACYSDHKHYVMKLALDPSGNTIASASLDKSIKFWDARGSKSSGIPLLKSTIANAHSEGVDAIAFADGNTIVSGGDDNLVKVWNVRTKSCLHTFSGHLAPITDIAVHPKLPHVMTVAEDGTLIVWDREAGREMFRQPLARSPDEKLWAVATPPEKPVVVIGGDSGLTSIKLQKERPIAAFNDGRGSKDLFVFVGGLKQFSTRLAVQHALAEPSGATEPATLIDAAEEEGSRACAAVHVTPDQEPVSIGASPNGQYVALLSKPRAGGIVNDLSVFSQGSSWTRRAISGEGTPEQCLAFSWYDPLTEQEKRATVQRFATLVAGYDAPQLHLYAWDPDAHQFHQEVAATLVYGQDTLFNGPLITLSHGTSLIFHPWPTAASSPASQGLPMIGSFDLQSTIKSVHWSDVFEIDGEQVALVAARTASRVVIIQYCLTIAERRLAELSRTPVSAETVACPEAWRFVGFVNEKVKSALWVDHALVSATDSGVYSSVWAPVNPTVETRPVGRRPHLVAITDKPAYLVGQVTDRKTPRTPMLLGVDRGHTLTGYPLSLDFIQVRLDVTQGRVTKATEFAGNMPEDEREKVSAYMETAGHIAEALSLTKRPDRRLELAIRAGEFDQAVVEAENIAKPAVWRSLADEALKHGALDIAERGYTAAGDLDSMFLMYSATGQTAKLAEVTAKLAEMKQHNLAFFGSVLTGNRVNARQVLIDSGEPKAVVELFERAYYAQDEEV